MKYSASVDSTQSKRRIDIPWIITVLLFTSIYVNRMNVYGSFILIGLTLLMLLNIVVFSDRISRIELCFFHFYMFFFALYCLMSCLWALNADDAITKGITLFEIMICMSVFFIYYSHDPHGVEKLLRAVLWSGYIVSFYTVFDYGIRTIVSLLKSGDRLISTFNNVNEIAGLCALTIVVTVFFWMEDHFSLEYLLVLPSFFLLIVCGSKRGFISFVVCITLLLLFKLFSKKENIGTKGKIVLIGVLFVLGLTFLAGTSIVSGLSERMGFLVASITGQGEVDHSTMIRKELIAYGFTIFESHPLFGIGIGCPHILISKEFNQDYYLHNNFVEVLAGGGLVGFLLYYSIYVLTLFSILKHGGINESRNRIVLAILAFLLIADVASGAYYSKETYFLLMLCYLQAHTGKKSEDLNIESGEKQF